MARPSIRDLEARVAAFETFTRKMLEVHEDWMHAVHFLAQRKRRKQKSGIVIPFPPKEPVA
jgi:hypothetical protein